MPAQAIPRRPPPPPAQAAHWSAPPPTRPRSPPRAAAFRCAAPSPHPGTSAPIRFTVKKFAEFYRMPFISLQGETNIRRYASTRRRQNIQSSRSNLRRRRHRRHYWFCSNGSCLGQRRRALGPGVGVGQVDRQRVPAPRRVDAPPGLAPPRNPLHNLHPPETAAV